MSDHLIGNRRKGKAVLSNKDRKKEQVMATPLIRGPEVNRKSLLPSRGAMTPDRLRQTAMALAVGRTAMGVTALAAPSLIWRPWVGDTRSVPARVLGRALGGRDLALGLGALAALRAVPPASVAAGTSVGAAAKAAGVWVGFAAVADSLDLVTTAAAWDELPAAGRWLIATTAGGAAVAGAVAAWSLITRAADDGS